MRGLWLGLAVAVAGCAMAASPALAAPNFYARATTEGNRYVYRFVMRAGPRDERFEVGIGLPCYVAGCRHAPAGYVLDEVGTRVTGPGKALLAHQTSDYAFGSCIRGATSATTSASMTLPAGTTTTLELRYRPLRPWDDTDYRLRFEVAGGTLARRRTIVSPAPARLRRRRGVRFDLTTRPRLPFSGDRPLRRGSLLRITGVTEPGLARRVVTLRYRHSLEPNAVYEGPSRPLASVRVDSRGRFRHRWRPAATGTYAVFASYAGDRVRTRDTSCPTPLAVSR